MVKEPYVFIEYAKEDSPFVDNLVRRLREAGVSVWMDIDEIHPGASVQDEIFKGLSGASAFIYVSSVNSHHSKWMGLTAKRAIATLSGKFISIVLDNVGEQHLPDFFRHTFYIDFRNDYESALKVLLAGLRDFIRKEDAPVAVTPVQASLGTDKAPFREAETEDKEKAKGYVFISYDIKDLDFVKLLRKFLGDRGYAYWDYNESNRDYDNQFCLELEGVIKEAAGTLSVVSPEWKRSDWSVKEYLFSMEIGTPVFLLKVRDPGPTLLIAGINFIDFTADLELGFKGLDRELKRKGL